MALKDTRIRLGKSSFDGSDVRYDFLPGDRSGIVLTIGGTGSGKSFAVKTLAGRMMSKGTRFLVVDNSPQPEYSALVEAHGGISFGPAAGDQQPYDLLNPAWYPAEYGGDVRSGVLQAVLRALSPGKYTESHAMAADYVLSLADGAKGSPANMGDWLKAADVLTAMDAGSPLSFLAVARLTEGYAESFVGKVAEFEARRRADVVPAEVGVFSGLLSKGKDYMKTGAAAAALAELSSQVRPYVREDGMLSFLPSLEDLQSRARMRVFRPLDSHSESLAAAASVEALLSYVLGTADGKAKQVVVVEEAWKYLSHPGFSAVATLAREGRKAAIGLWLTGQNLEDFETETGRVLLGQAHSVLVFRQWNPGAAESLLGIPAAYTSGLRPGEFVVVPGGREVMPLQVNVDPSPDEMAIATTTYQPEAVQEG